MASSFFEKDPAAGMKRQKATTADDDTKSESAGTGKKATKGSAKSTKTPAKPTSAKETPKELHAKMVANLLEYIGMDEAAMDRALATAGGWCKMMLADEARPRVEIAPSDGRTSFGMWVRRNWTGPSFLEAKKKARARSQGYTIGPIVLAYYRAEARKGRLNPELAERDKIDFIAILVRQELAQVFTQEILAPSSDSRKPARFVWGDRIEVPFVDPATVVLKNVAATIQRETTLANLRSDMAQTRNFFKKLPTMLNEQGEPDSEAYGIIEPALLVSRAMRLNMR